MFVNNDWTFAESSNGAKWNEKGLRERGGLVLFVSSFMSEGGVSSVLPGRGFE